MAKETSDVRELPDETLEAVSGGSVRIPSSHAEIDAAWDAVQSAANTSGFDAAAAMAFDMGLIPFALNSSNENYFVSEKTISDMRGWMHDALDWIEA